MAQLAAMFDCPMRVEEHELVPVPPAALRRRYVSEPSAPSAGGAGQFPGSLFRVPTPFSNLAQAPEATTDARFASTSSTASEGLAARLAAIRCPATEAPVLLKALTELRTELSAQSNPPIQAVIDLGGIEALVQRLGDGCSAAAQLEATWALTNIACGTAAHTSALVDGGAIEALFGVLTSAELALRPELCDQVLWALGNVAGEGVAFRDRLLSAGIVGVLGQLYLQVPTFQWHLHFLNQVLRTLTWLLSSLCRGSPAPPVEEVDCCYDFFAQVLLGTEDAQMLGEALWGLLYLLEGASGAAGQAGEEAASGARLLSAGFAEGETPPTPHPVVVRIVECAKLGVSGGNPMSVPALRLLGQMVSMPAPALTDAAVAAGAPQALLGAMEDRRVPLQVRRDAAWALQNIAAGTEAQVHHLLSGEGVWSSLARAIHNDTLEVSRECAWAVVNIVKGGSGFSRTDGGQVLPLVITALRTEQLRERSKRDVALQSGLLDALEVALEQRGHDQGAQDAGVFDVLEAVAQSDQENVKAKASQLLQAYFGADQENEPPRRAGSSPQKAESLELGSPKRSPNGGNTQALFARGDNRMYSKGGS